MVNRKTVSALTIAALLTCAIPVRSMASALLSPVTSTLLAQATPSFPLPDSVKENTEVVISSSSDNMNAISEALKSGFEGKYDSSKVSIEAKGANEAIQDVLNGNADLAAISRPLTEEEKAKSLFEVAVRREKIAIVVGKDNPFNQSITGEQFAKIFRGEIKDWSEVGGAAGPIKLVDRPATSETRQALSPYPVFKAEPFKAAADATTLEADTTEAVVKAIGNNGISYVLVGELDSNPDLKALQLHKTPPTDAKYPFSQPYSFVYAGGPSEAVSAFLGYATGNPGQADVNNAGLSGAGVVPNAGSGNTTANADTAADSATDTADANSEGETPDATASEAAGETPDTPADGATPDDATDGTTIEASKVTVAGLDGELGTADDINISGPDGVIGTADDIRGLGPDGVIGTADDIDLAGPDGVAGTADDVVLAGPDGEIGTADDIVISETPAAGGLGNLVGNGKWWWLLLPLAGLGLLIWAAGRRGSEEETGYIANAEGSDRIRSNIGGDANISGTNVDGLDVNASGVDVDSKGIGIGKIAAGGAAIAGGAAAAGAGIAGRMKNKAGDVTMDLQEGVSGSVKGGIDGVKGGIDGVKGGIGSGVDGIKGGIGSGIDGVKGGVDGLKGNIQGGVDGIKGGVQGGIGSGIDGVKGGVDGLKGNIQGGVDGIKGGIGSGVDGIKGTVQGSIDGVKGGVQGSIDGIKGAGAAGLGAGAAGLGAAGAGLSGLRDKAQDGLDGVRGGAQDSLDSAKGAVEGAKEGGSSWLDRAKQRINEATEQVKDTASDVKDDLTKND